MKLTTIEKEWAKDSHIDKQHLEDESIQIPKLHAKYSRYYMRERAMLLELEGQIKELEFILTEYYRKNLSDEEMQEYDLPELPNKVITNNDVKRYVDVYPDTIKLKKRYGFQNDKIEMLKSILSQLSNRSFQINNAIKFLRFQQGLDD